MTGHCKKQGGRPRSKSDRCARTIVAYLAGVGLIAGAAQAQSGGGYVIKKSAVNGSAVSGVTDGGYAMSGSVGQPDAANLTGGDYFVSGGFWSPAVAVCTAAGAPTTAAPAVAKNRFVSFEGANAGARTAIRVTFESLPGEYQAFNGKSMWVGPPGVTCENPGQATPAGEPCSTTGGSPREFMAATLQCEPFYADWSALGTVHVFDEFIVPGGAYALEAIAQGCDAATAENFSAPLVLETAAWADLVSTCDTDPCGAPDGNVNVNDILAVLNKFANFAGAPRKVRTDTTPATVNLIIDVADMTHALDAFADAPYPFPPPPFPCP